MNRIAFCEACNMLRNGVKSRIALEHTCGLQAGEFPENPQVQLTGDTFLFDMNKKKILKKDKDGNIHDISK